MPVLSGDIDPDTLPLVEKNARKVLENRRRLAEKEKECAKQRSNPNPNPNPNPRVLVDAISESDSHSHNIINNNSTDVAAAAAEQGGENPLKFFIDPNNKEFTSFERTNNKEFTSFERSRFKREEQRRLPPREGTGSGTANANANAIKAKEHVKLDTSSFRYDGRPIDPACHCYTCRNFSRSYLHHLVKSEELLYASLLTIHNVHFMNTMMSDIRRGITEGSLDEVEREYVHPSLIVDISAASKKLE